MPTATSSLPSRPWVRGDVPLAWRDDQTLQVGDAARVAVVHGADRELVRWLVSLEGDRTLKRALDDAERAGMERDAALSLLRQVLPTGLVDDSDALPEGLRSATPELRHRLAGDLAAARLSYGSAHEAGRALTRRIEGSVAIHGDNALADSVAAALTSAGVVTIARASRLSSSSRRGRRAGAQRSCHVLCDVAHPEAAADPDAMALDIPHLPVVAFGSRAAIGPFVLPGLTGCLRCRDLHRADHDPAWPRIAVQLQQRRRGVVPVDSALALTAAGWAALQVLTWLEADDSAAGALRWPLGWPAAAPDSVGGVIEIARAGGTITRRACPPHPLCGCRWPAGNA